MSELLPPNESLTELAVAQPVAVMHSLRFRRVANGYARVVALAYDRDLVAAALDSDERVAERVAGWERSQGIAPRDWQAIGRAERADDEP